MDEKLGNLEFKSVSDSQNFKNGSNNCKIVKWKFNFSDNEHDLSSTFNCTNIEQKLKRLKQAKNIPPDSVLW